MRTTLAIALTFGAATAATAGVETYTGSTPLRVTDWSHELSIPQFDTLGGARELERVEWTIIGRLEGRAEIESLDAQAALVMVNIASDLTLMLDGELLDSMTASSTESINATPFDGIIDFGGGSGSSIGPVLATVSSTEIDTNTAAYLGTGVMPLTMTALGSSWASGTGNLITSFSTSASLEYEVNYIFRGVPTPGTLMAFSGLALAGARRRRAGA